MRFKIDWASPIVGIFYFVFEGNFHVQVLGGLIFGGAILRRVFCVTILGGLYLEGLIHGGVYFRNFTVCLLRDIRGSNETVRVELHEQAYKYSRVSEFTFHQSTF